MMKLKRFFILILSTLCLSAVLLGLVGCGCSDETEGQKYEYTYSSYYDGPNDPDILIDGNLTEDCWQNKKWFTNRFCADIKDNMPMISATAFNTGYGTYIGVKIRDNNIIYSGMLDLEKNSVLEFYFYANKNDVVTKDNDYSQCRAFMMDYACDLYSTGERMKRAVVVDGEFNSGETKGATFEIFIPWAELGIDVSKGEIPKLFYMLPEYRPVLKGKTKNTLLYNAPLNLMNHIGSFYLFDENGYTDQDEEGAIVGDSIYGTAKSGGWDIENVANKEVAVTKGMGNNTIFFKEAYCENFEAEATLYPMGGNSGDTWWSGGFAVVSLNGGINYMMMLDMSNSRLQPTKDGKYTLKTYSLNTLETREEPYVWRQKAKAVKANPDVHGTSVPAELGTKFKIIKYGTTVCYFVNDVFLYAETLDLLQGSFYVGLFNMNGFCAYKNLSFKEYSGEEADAALKALDIYKVDLSVSGGGDAKLECNYVKSGDGNAAKIDLTCYSGYTLSEVKCDGDDITDDVKENAVDGVYDLEGISKDIEVNVEFTAINNSLLKTYKGNLRRDEVQNDKSIKMVNVDGAVTVISKDCGACKYEVTATASGGFEVKLAPGEYVVKAGGYFGAKTVTVSADVADNVDVALATTNLGTELYSGKMYKYGDDDELTYIIPQYSTGATVLNDVAIEQNKAFMISAKIGKTDATGVGFVVGTLGTDNSKHLMFNWRPMQQDIYVTREGNGWDWKGHADGVFACDKVMEDINDIALVYMNGAYLFIINGSVVANIPERGDVSWGLVLKDVIGTEGVKHLGLSGLSGKIDIVSYKLTTDESAIKDSLKMLPLYNGGTYTAKNEKDEIVEYAIKGATIIENDDAFTINATGTVGAFIFNDVEVNAGEEFMITAKISNLTAENVGFVIGNLDNDNANHVMFDWRNKIDNGKEVKDIYVWRHDTYGWKGIEGFSCDVARDKKEYTLTFIYKNNMYYLLIDGVIVFETSETANFSGVELKSVIGTTGKIKIGLSTSFGTATFSDFRVSTDLDEINATLPSTAFVLVEDANGLYPNSMLFENSEDSLKIMAAGENVGAFIIDETGVDAGTEFMVTATISNLAANNVGFVIGNLANDNKNHVMFNWRNQGDTKDIYVWRHDTYGWRGIEGPNCNVARDKSEYTLTFIYYGNMYYMLIDGTTVLEISEDQTFEWSSDTIKGVIGTTGKIKIGLSASFGMATFSNFRVSTDIDEVKAALPATVYFPVDDATGLYSGSTLLKNSEGSLKASSAGVVGAFIINGEEVTAGEDFMVTVKVDNISAENVGFVIGNLANDNANHLMFDWRNSGANKDIYVWRTGSYGWKGHEDNTYPCTLGRSGEHTMTLVCKSGTYYMIIDGTQVFNKAGSADIGWGTVINNCVGTTGTIKIGLTTSYGTATFSDFNVTTDAAAINAVIGG